MEPHRDDLEPETSSRASHGDWFVASPVGARSARRYVTLGLASLLLAAVIGFLAWPRGAPGPARGTSGTSVVSRVTISTAVPLRPQTPFPQFGEWRVVYLADDSRLHAVSLDGTRDTAGLTMPDLAAALDSGFGRAAISPDGRELAYSTSSSHGSGPLMLAALDAATAPAPVPNTLNSFARELAWSPDGTSLAYLDNITPDLTALYLVHPPALAAATEVPGSQQYDQGVLNLVGWLDPDHLLVEAAAPPRTNLAALDVATGALRAIAELPDDSAHVILSPDARTAFVFTPGGGTHTELINLTTGQTRALPRIGATLPTTLLASAWQPGSMLLTIAASDQPGQTAPASFLLDLAADTLAPLDGHTWVWGWSPDGAALIVGTPLSVAVPGLPPSLLALTLATGSTPRQQLTLTNAALGFVGFAR